MNDKWIPYIELDLESRFIRIDTRDFHGYTDNCKDSTMYKLSLAQEKKI